jgi:hypothetical protein
VDYSLKLSTSLLGVILLLRGVFALASQPVIILHFMDVGFLSMGICLVAGIVAKWMSVPRRPWYVWLGDPRFGPLTRQLIPMFVFFILVVAVFFTGVFLLAPDIAALGNN